MKEVKYYVSDDGRFRADNPEGVIKYEEETENRVKKELQKLCSEFHHTEGGYVSVVDNIIKLFYFGPYDTSILQDIKNRLNAATLSGVYGYIVDKKDINTKIYEVNKR